MDDVVVVVGAGPAGLAAAAMLRAHRIDAVLLERGQSLGEPWRARYDRLHLHTIRWLSDLPGYQIPADFGRWVARDDFVEYLEQYAAHHHLVPGSGSKPRVLTGITAAGLSEPPMARFPRMLSWLPAAIRACRLGRNGLAHSTAR
jgi:phytoene dehydrogenase-like protein